MKEMVVISKYKSRRKIERWLSLAVVIEGSLQYETYTVSLSGYLPGFCVQH